MSASGFKSEGVFAHDNLIAGDYPVIQKKGILLAGQNLSRGALLGKITANDKLNLSLSAAGDGSEVPYAVLAEDADATSGDKEVIYYLSGEFNENAITFGTGHTAENAEAALRVNNTYLKSNLGA